MAVWLWSAYNPANSLDWFTENKMTFFFLPIVFGFCIWYVQFSKLSFTLITTFLILHIIGSHYGYGSVPFGYTLADWTGVDSNNYDKLVHFSFGLLIVYPLREFFLRVSPAKGFWAYLLPFNAVMMMAALYEIFEWVTVLQLDPKTAYLFIGGNDPFDTTKDMFVAAVGALITLSIVAILEWVILKEKFWPKMRDSFIRDGRDHPKEDVLLHKDIL
ncbi:MAG: DUF2238 domain-containing protein [Ignavibacteriae bacterium]|nr:DUF2238 domain-containing protein [Ignavibacteriota bacterium]